MVVQMEEEEYMREAIQWDRTEFPDNQPCVDLIEKKPMGEHHLLVTTPSNKAPPYPHS
jgi:myosin heavy subunit